MGSRSIQRRAKMVQYRVAGRWKGFILQAQGGLCASCGKPVRIDRRCDPQNADAPTVDHLLAKSRGGREHPTNKVVMHRKCNERKGARLPTGCELIFGAIVGAHFEGRDYPEW